MEMVKLKKNEIVRNACITLCNKTIRQLKMKWQKMKKKKQTVQSIRNLLNGNIQFVLYVEMIRRRIYLL